MQKFRIFKHTSINLAVSTKDYFANSLGNVFLHDRCFNSICMFSLQLLSVYCTEHCKLIHEFSYSFLPMNEAVHQFDTSNEIVGVFCFK